MCQDIDELVNEAQIQIRNGQKRRDPYYNIQRRDLEIKVDYLVLLEKQWFSFRW